MPLLGNFFKTKGPIELLNVFYDSGSVCGGAAAAYGVAKLRTLRSSPHGVHSSVVHVCAHSVRLTEKGRSVAFAEQTASALEAALLLHFTKSY